MSEQFKPNQHITKIQGRDYLEVKWRIVWFRNEFPEGSIQVDYSPVGDSLIIVKASIFDGTHKHLADGSATVRKAEGRESKSWGGRDIEKAETAAIGRALGHAGFGTQFTGDDEGSHIADSPVGNSNQSNRRQSQPRNSSAGNRNNNNRFVDDAARRRKVLDGTSSYFESMNDLMQWANTNGVDWGNKSADIIAYINTAMANANAS